MKKISIDDLKKIKEARQDTMKLREGGPYRVNVTVHMGTCGIAAGARKILSAFLDLVESKKTKDVIVSTSGCAGLCSREPMITVEIEGAAPIKYGDLAPEKAAKIFEEHVLGGKVVKDYVLAVGHERLA